MAAAFLSEPLLKLDAAEAAGLAAALSEVNRHYKVPVVSPEHMAIGALLVVLGNIYVPRVFMVIQQRKASKQPPANTDPNVFPFPGFAGAGA